MLLEGSGFPAQLKVQNFALVAQQLALPRSYQ
jgi:hypothetical protein